MSHHTGVIKRSLRSAFQNSAPTITKKHLTLIASGLIIVALLVAACGGSSTSGAASVPAPSNPSAHPPAAGQGGTSSGVSQGTSGTGSPYLIKALAVNMSVKDTRQVASDLQTWISTTDPRSSSAGVDFEQVDNNLYNVSMQFSVQASMYSQVKLYLEDYTAQHGGQLLSLHETVQDVSNDYIDSQSRLKNLRGEQQRLLTLLSSATALGDILSIEQKLTDVEGQIEQLEAHINALNGQITYYTVSINLQPLTPAGTPPPSPSTWSAFQTLQDAWAASVGFGQALLTLFIWLLTFSIYIIPVAAIGWFVWYRRRARRIIAPLEAPISHSQTTP